MARSFGVRLAFLAFAAATLDGAGGGASFGDTLQTALGHLAIGLALGMICGGLADRMVDELAQVDLQHLIAAADEPQAEPN